MTTAREEMIILQTTNDEAIVTTAHELAHMCGMCPTKEELAKKRKYRIQEVVEQIMCDNKSIKKYSSYVGMFSVYYFEIWIKIKLLFEWRKNRTIYEWLKQFASLVLRICYNIVVSTLGIVTKHNKDFLKETKAEKAQALKKLENYLTYSKDQTAEEFQEENKRDDAIDANRMPFFRDDDDGIPEVYIRCQEKNLVTLCELGLKKIKNYLKSLEASKVAIRKLESKIIERKRKQKWTK